MFFDDLFSNLSSSWYRSFKEKDGYTVMEAKNGYIIVFNTLGVAESDIKVNHQPSSKFEYVDEYGRTRSGESTYIRVNGNTKIKELNDQVFSVNYEIKFNNPNPVDEVQYMVKDGLTIVYIKTKEAEIDEGTSAKNIANGESFDW